MMRALSFSFGYLLSTSAVFGCCVVSGTVADPAGLPAPDSQVRLGEFGTVVTNADGEFRLINVPAGEHVLTVTRDGFAPVERKLRLRSSLTNIRITLQLARHSSSLTVTDSPARIDLAPEENRSAIEIDHELLSALPAMNGDFTAVAGQLVDPSIAGAEPTLVVNGVETGDIGVTASAISEVRINRNPFSAEYSRPGSARIEVITREGSADFHGDLNVYFRDHRLDARNAFALERPRQARRVYEGNLSGGLGRSGKATFLVSAEREEDNEQAVVYARTPEALIVRNFLQPERENEASFGINRYQSEKHFLSWRYRYERETAGGQGVGEVVLPEAGFAESETSHRGYFQHRWFMNAWLFTDLSVRFGNDSDGVVSVQPDREQIVVRHAFIGGSAQRQVIERRRSVELSFTMALSRSKHSLRAGFLIPNMDWRRVDDRSNFAGTWTFASLEDYAAERPLSFTQNTGDSLLRYGTRNIAFFVQDDIQVRGDLTLGMGLRYDRQNVVGDANNFAPRASVAWALGQNRKTVLRAGGGLFYNRLGSGLFERVLRLDGVRMRQLLIVDPAYPDPFTAGLPQAIPPNVFRLDAQLRSPYLMQSSLSLEREVSRAITAALTYRYIRGVSLFRSVDANPPLPLDFTRRLAGYAAVHTLQSSAALKSHSLTMTIQVTGGKMFRGTALYTLGRTLTHADDEDTLPPDSLDLSREWGRATSDRRHRFRLLGSWRLPAGLTLGTIFEADSGRPYEWTTGRDLNRDGLAIERPAGLNRNALEGPGRSALDVRLSRKLVFGKDRAVSGTISADAFNVFNQVNLTRTVGNESSPFFLSPVAAAAARRLQLSFHLSF
jgi:hypothetical protein